MNCQDNEYYQEEKQDSYRKQRQDTIFKEIAKNEYNKQIVEKKLIEISNNIWKEFKKIDGYKNKTIEFKTKFIKEQIKILKEPKKNNDKDDIDKPIIDKVNNKININSILIKLIILILSIFVLININNK